MSFTREEIDEFYNTFKEAYLALASGVKSYTINTGTSSRSVSRADLPEIKKEMMYWSKMRNPSGDIETIQIEPKL